MRTGAAEFRVRQLELADRQAELQLSLAQANSRMRQLTGSNVDETVPFWPEADWKVTVEPIDVHAVVSDGLYRRADVNLLRMLMNCLDADSLDGVRSSLSAISGVAASPRAGIGLLGAGSNDEVDVVAAN